MTWYIEYIKYANLDLSVNFWNFLLTPFWFMMKKDHFKQKLFLWPCVSVNSWHLRLLIVPYSPFETLEYWHNWLLSNWSSLELISSPRNVLKIIALSYIYQFAKFVDLMNCRSKEVFKNAPCLLCQSTLWIYSWGFFLWQQNFAVIIILTSLQ